MGYNKCIIKPKQPMNVRMTITLYQKDLTFLVCLLGHANMAEFTTSQMNGGCIFLSRRNDAAHTHNFIGCIDAEWEITGHETVFEKEEYKNLAALIGGIFEENISRLCLTEYESEMLENAHKNQKR